MKKPNIPLLISTFKDRLRAWPWLALAFSLVFIVSVIAPHQVGVLVWSLSKICIAAYLGYWIDRSMFPKSRPHQVTGQCHSTAMIRRAIIISAVIIALGLGV